MPKAETPAVKQREPLHPIITTTSFQMVSVDFLHLESSAGGYQYILVVMDHFTRYAQAYATKDKSAKTAAEKLYNDFILRFGLPETIHHDQGGEFVKKLFYHLDKLIGACHSRTTPYHPQGDGQVESLPEKHKSITSTKWYTRKTARETTLLVMRLSFSCLAESRVFQSSCLTSSLHLDLFLTLSM